MKTLLLTNKLFTIKLQINLDIEISYPFAALFRLAVFVSAMFFQMIFVVQNIAFPFGDFFFFTNPNLFGYLINESEVVTN